MDYENYKGKILEIISNNRRFCKIKDIYESGDKVVIKTIDDLTYEITPDEFRMLSTDGYAATVPHILYYMHDSLPEGYFDKKMEPTEKLWRTLNRLRDNAEDVNNIIISYFNKVKYWINNDKRNEVAEIIEKEIAGIGLESKLRNVLLSIQSFSTQINYPDFKWSQD